MEWTQILWLVTAAIVGYNLGFARGVFYAIRRARELRELMEQLDLEEEELAKQTVLPMAKQVVTCRAELVGDVMYLYQQKEDSEQFLAQGADLKQLSSHVKFRVGDVEIQVDGTKESERAWFKQFGKDA